MIGIVLKDASARRQSFIIMITTTPMTVINSGIRVVTIFVRTSFSELTSPMILARIFPVGLLSKNEKDNVWICSYKSCRIFNNILLEITDILYILTFTRMIKRTFSESAKIPSAIRPLKSDCAM